MRINDILQNNFLIQLSLAAAGEVTPAFFVLSKRKTTAVCGLLLIN